MRASTLERLNRIRETGYEFKFGDYFSLGFKAWGKYWYGFLGAYAILVAMTIVTSLVPYVGNLLTAMVTMAMNIGIAMVTLQLFQGTPPDFSSFFGGFKQFLQIVVIVIVQNIVFGLIAFAGIMIVFADFPVFELLTADPLERISLFEAYMEGINPLRALWLLLLLIPVIYLAVSWCLALFFIGFEEANFWEAMEWSRKVVAKQWLMTLVLIICAAIVSALGVLLCGIGVLATAPMYYCILFAMYYDVVGVPEEAEGMSIEDHFMPEEPAQ